MVVLVAHVKEDEILFYLKSSILFMDALDSGTDILRSFQVIHKKDHVGDATGSLGFADELLAIVVSPIAGLISDRIGVRAVCFYVKCGVMVDIAYLPQVCVGAFLIIAFALFVTTHAKRVYPDLLLARLVFSIGGASASCMLTAILPIVSASHLRKTSSLTIVPENQHSTAIVSDESSLIESAEGSQVQSTASSATSGSSSRVAGVVGFFSGIGALIALLLLLRLPALFQQKGVDTALAVRYSFYITGSLSGVSAVACFFGLRGINRKEEKNAPQVIPPMVSKFLSIL